MGSNNGQFPSENDATIVMNDINVNPFHNENDVTSTHALQVDNLPFIADHFMLFGSQPIVMILCFR